MFLTPDIRARLRPLELSEQVYCLLHVTLGVRGIVRYLQLVNVEAFDLATYFHP
jgi:hypothetical protein